MDKTCKIVPVKEGPCYRWRWRTVSESGAAPRQSAQTYELFYECVVAARAAGLQPENVRSASTQNVVRP